MRESRKYEGMSDVQLGDMEGIELVTLETYKAPPQRKRKRKKRKGPIILTAFFCVLALTAVTGCIVLIMRNQELQTEVNEAMAYIDEVNSITVYTEEETRKMIEDAVREAAQNAAQEAAFEKEE